MARSSTAGGGAGPLPQTDISWTGPLKVHSSCSSTFPDRKPLRRAWTKSLFTVHSYVKNWGTSPLFYYIFRSIQTVLFDGSIFGYLSWINADRSLTGPDRSRSPVWSAFLDLTAGSGHWLRTDQERTGQTFPRSHSYASSDKLIATLKFKPASLSLSVHCVIQNRGWMLRVGHLDWWRWPVSL